MNASAGTAVVVQQTPGNAVAEIASPAFKAKITNALPGGARDVDRFISVAVTAIRLDPDLLRHDRESLFNSLIRCAQDGLLPDGREAAMVVFGGKVQYMPMVTGLRKRAAEFGISIAAYVVCQNDTFDWELGFAPSVSHRPPPLDQERGAPIGAYAVATDRDGAKYLEVMSKGEIEAVRKVSRAKGAGPWTTWWGEMARKTVARRLFKSLPLHTEAISSLLDAVDAEFDHGDAEQRVDRAIGYVGPPTDTEQPDDGVSTGESVVSPTPDDTAPGTDFIEGHAVPIEDETKPAESAGEPEGAPAPVADDAPGGAASVAQADSPVEPASPAVTPDATPVEPQQTSFEEMAARAQRAKQASK
jgi:recombination protein RecT